MKRITLCVAGDFSTRDVISQIMGANAVAGFSIQEMRRRLKVMDAVEASAESHTVDIEDSDYEMLKRAVNIFTFSIAHKDLLVVLDGILEATDVPEAR